MRSIRAVSTRRQARQAGGDAGRLGFPSLRPVPVEVWAEACIQAGLPRHWAPVAAKAARRAYAREKARFERDLRGVFDAILSSGVGGVA